MRVAGPVTGERTMQPEREQPDMPDPLADLDAPVRLVVEQDAARARIVVHPNRSLTGFAFLVAAGACLSALLPATLLMLALGAWPLAPFLGLEIFVVIGAFVFLHRHRDDREEIVLDSEQVAITRVHGGAVESSQFPRYWVRLVVEPAVSRYRPGRLWLRSHGRRVELARDAAASTRGALARTLSRDFGIARAASTP